MATKGDISNLDTLMFGGKPMVPLISGFSRSRRTGLVQNTVEAGRTRQRKKFYGNCYQAQATFYFETKQEQDFIKIFFERNEGKTFVCHLSADRPIVEPYTVRIISEWEDDFVSQKDGTMTVTLEIDSVRNSTLDDTLFELYQTNGNNVYDNDNVSGQISDNVKYDLLSGYTFSRDSTLWVVNDDGSISSLAIDEPAVNSRGIWVHGDYAAYCSNDSGTTLNDATDTDVIVVTNELAPDGSTYWCYIANTDDGEFNYYTENNPFTVGSKLTFSLFVKKNTGLVYVNIGGDFSNRESGVTVFFNSDNGGISGAIDQKGIVEYDDCYRIWIETEYYDSVGTYGDGTFSLSAPSYERSAMVWGANVTNGARGLMPHVIKNGSGNTAVNLAKLSQSQSQKIPSQGVSWTYVTKVHTPRLGGTRSLLDVGADVGFDGFFVNTSGYLYFRLDDSNLLIGRLDDADTQTIVISYNSEDQEINRRINDGSVVTYTDVGALLIPNSSTLHIGSVLGTTWFLDGQIEVAEFYHKSMTKEEIYELEV